MTALDQLHDWDVPHAAAAVFRADGTLHRHGDTSRPFELASVSKVLFAIAAHVATEEGTVGLDDPAGPEGSTVRHLLAHASGLPPDGEAVPLGPPASKRIYSNVGFELLGRHLAEHAGMATTEYVQLALVEALDLQATSVEGSPAHGYTSSVDDLVAVVRAVVDGTLLAPTTGAAMTTPAFPELSGVLPGYGGQDPNPWGLGVEIRGNKSPHWTAATNSARTWGHFGRAGTFVWWDPDVALGLVVLTDRDFGAWAVDAWPPLAAEVLGEFGS